MIAASFAVMFSMLACSSPADKATEYSNQMKAAVEANDAKKFAEIYEEAMKWMKELSAEDQKAAQDAIDAWQKANPDFEAKAEALVKKNMPAMPEF